MTTQDKFSSMNKLKLSQLALFTALLMGSACDGKAKDEPAQAAAAEAGAAEAGAPAEAGAEGEAKAPADPAAQAEADELLAEDLGDLDPKVQKAVTIAREIEAAPDTADQVLAKHELDREGLDALMYEIARSPELAKAYRDARLAS